ncbi:D-aminoacyl-tRNA deacylase [Bacillota bacterium LX-D]|nr:D-aminoacyl-tRNA deacylase [Bacillota bacterium LX-D]
MRAVIQRVTKGKVSVQDEIVGQIGKGYVILLGIESSDSVDDVVYLTNKVVNLRIFSDQEGKMNLSIRDVQGEILVISQFTLLGDCRKGRRPSFGQAAPPQMADELYRHFVQSLKSESLKVETGCFQTDMLVEIYNDGPVTMLLDSKKVF